jgi:hypothetical protein
MPRPRIDDANEKNSVKKLVLMRPDEKEAFSQCAALAGIPLSIWIRERLRLAAIHELEAAGRTIPFVKAIPLGGSDD